MQKKVLLKDIYYIESSNTIDVVGGDSLILTRKKYSDFIKAYMRYAQDGGTINV